MEIAEMWAAELRFSGKSLATRDLATLNATGDPGHIGVPAGWTPESARVPTRSLEIQGASLPERL